MTALQISGADVVDDGVAKDVIESGPRENVATAGPDDHAQLDLVVEFPGQLGADANRSARTDHRRRGFGEELRHLRQVTV
jgi:hypothetical protein